MSRFGPRGKYGNLSVGPSSILDTLRAHPTPVAAKVLTPREREREAASKNPEGYLYLSDLLDWERGGGPHENVAGTGLKSHFSVSTAGPGEIEATGMYSRIFD